MIELDVPPKKRKDQLRPRTPARLRKVYYGHYDHQFSSPHPVIRLGGRYLEAYGFTIGDTIDVVLEPHCITIKRIPQQNPSKA